MIDLDVILQLVANSREAGLDSWEDDSAFVQRVRGGMNNALYYVMLDGVELACKLCVPDDRQRAHREYGALSLLRASGLDLAPAPLGLDESLRWLPYPVVVYEWLPGEPLGGAPTREQWMALCDNYQRLHACRRDAYPEVGLPSAFFHWMDRGPYLDELRHFLARYGPWLRDCREGGSELLTRLERLVRHCEARFQDIAVDLGADALPLCLCRVDPNPANVIVGAQDATLRWVDWEFSGWGDPALDLADLRWHVAFLDMAPSWHERLRAVYQPPSGDHSFAQRLSLWDTLLSVRWPFLVLRLLWSQENGPDRLRLTRPTIDQATLWERLLRLIERAGAWDNIRSSGLGEEE